MINGKKKIIVFFLDAFDKFIYHNLMIIAIQL